MPEISRFFGIWIGMYHREHAPPRFHVWYAGREARVEIRTLHLIEGRLPPRTMGLVVAWASQHQAELSANWDLAQEHRPLRKIRPL